MAYMTHTSQERRHFQRIPMEIGVYCSPIRNRRLADTLESQSENLCAGGLAVRCHKPLRQGDLLIVSFSLPMKSLPKVEASSFTTVNTPKPLQIVIRARVIWVSQIAGDEYEFGLQFVGVDQFAHRPLMSYLSENYLH